MTIETEYGDYTLTEEGQDLIAIHTKTKERLLIPGYTIPNPDLTHDVNRTRTAIEFAHEWMLIN